VPRSVGEAGSPSNTMSRGPRPTSAPSGILIHPAVWPQYTNITDRTDTQDRKRSYSIRRTVLQTVAQKRDFSEERNNVPATSCPLKVISTSCGTATRGVNEACSRRLPRGWTVHGTVPPFTVISRSPCPAFTAFTVRQARGKNSLGFPDFRFHTSIN